MITKIQHSFTELSSEACMACKGHCCNHISLPIDKPKCKQDYDYIRWYLMHKNVFVYIDFDNTWMIEFRSPCINIQTDGRCGIYENRLKICSDFPPKDEECEFLNDSPTNKKLFSTVEEFEVYLEDRKIDWRFKNKPKVIE